MRKLGLGLATATAVIATPAIARDGAWYVGGDFGAMIVEDTSVDVNGVNDALSLNHEYGFDGALFVGYDLGAFRIEAEASYKRANVSDIEFSTQVPGVRQAGTL